MSARARRVAVIVAGHRGDSALPTSHLDDDDGDVRAAALHALERVGALTGAQVGAAFHDPDPTVRRQAAELAGRRPGIDLAPLLADEDQTVVEVAAWACGEQEVVADATLDLLVSLATGADEPLVREASAAALGAIGDERGLPAIITACADKPNVRRRAVLALAPFAGDEVDAAIERASSDRDWQVRQAAEDLRRAVGRLDLGAVGDQIE